MRPLRISARNVVCYQSLDLDVRELRNVVIIGENGAGKSLLTDLVRIGLFDVGRLGPRALAGMIGRWGDTASVELDFEHGGRVYRVTRTRRRTAKTSSRTDVVQAFDGSTWTPVDLDVETILGASAETLGATTFLRHRGADGLGDFGAAKPADRKGMLYELRRTDRYEGFATAARKRVTEAGALAAAASTRVARVREELEAARTTAAGVADLRDRAASLRTEIEGVEAKIATARAAAAARGELEAAERRAVEALAAAGRDAAAHLARVKALRERIDGHRRALENADAVREAVAKRSALAEEWRAAAERRSAASARATTATHARDAAERRLADARRQNETAKRVGELHVAAGQAASEVGVLEPLAGARDAFTRARDAVVAGRRQNEAAARAASLAREAAEVDAEVGVLEPLAGAVRDILEARAAVDADTARAAGLATVPCGGGGEFAACRFLVEAVAARDRLDPARARVESMIAEIRERAAGRGDVEGALRDGALPPLQRALAELRAKAAGLHGQLRALGTVEAVDLAPLEAAEAAAAAEVARVEAAVGHPVADARAALADAHRRQSQIDGQLRALGTVEAVDLAPLEAELARAEEEVRAARAAEEEAAAAVRAVEARGAGVKELAAQAPAVEAAAGALAADEASLAAHGDGSALAARVKTAEDEVQRARDAVAAATVEDVRALVDVASARRGDLARVEGQIATAEAAQRTAEARAAEIAPIEAEEREHLRQRALAGVLARFYGEAPSLIIENDRAAIERAANDWLRQTSALQVELVLQRPQKTDAAKVHETLEVDVLRPSGRAVRETCSAGELFRVDIGLAVGIGQALGAGRSWLCVDEGFGSLKGEVIGSVVRGLHEMLEELDGLWVVEHNPLVINVFPTRIVVRTGPDGSTVEVI